MPPPILSNERLISDIVLIVDDIPENLALLHDALDEAGHTVLVATNGESALQRARQSLPDVILLDALMPGMDGFEVARRLKADFATQHIPIVFMTGLTETEHVVAAFAAGGADYVTKPIRPPEVLAPIAAHVQDARQMRQARSALDAFGQATVAVRAAGGKLVGQTPLARRLMNEITARGRIPLLTGGTMLYYKALREGLSELPEAAPELRREIEDAAARDGWPALHAELARLDPDAAARLQPNDAQRIQRALEIVRLTGQPLAASYARREAHVDTHRFIPVTLTPSDRAVLHARIARRFDAMLLAGFVDEVIALRKHYQLDPNLPSMRCVGYRQALEYLDGYCDLPTFRDKGIFATRQLAKRQITWQRNFRESWGDLVEVDCLAAGMEKQVQHIVESRLD